MPRINAKKICQKHGIFDSIENTSCPLCIKQHNKQYDTHIRKSDRVKIYNSRKWKQVRQVALLRDNLMCIPCAKNGNDVLATEVHHIQYLEHRPDLAYSLDNLISICRTCHMNIHAKDNIK